MITLPKTSTLPNWSKNLISDQTWKDLILRFNTSVAFDATHGLGHDGTTTTAIMATTGGFADQKVTAVMKWRTTPAAGSEDFGVMFRFRCIESGQQNYYYARLFHSLACLYKVVNNTFTLLTSGAFVLPQDTDMTITATAIGTSLTAKFEASGVATVNLAATDSALTSGGAGLVGISCGFRAKSFSVEQLR